MKKDVMCLNCLTAQCAMTVSNDSTDPNIVKKTDVRRYFATPQESGELCLLSGLLEENRDIFFPKRRARI